jgi:hypothetical protein
MFFKHFYFFQSICFRTIFSLKPFIWFLEHFILFPKLYSIFVRNKFLWNIFICFRTVFIFESGTFVPLKLIWQCPRHTYGICHGQQWKPPRSAMIFFFFWIWRPVARVTYRRPQKTGILGAESPPREEEWPPRDHDRRFSHPSFSRSNGLITARDTNWACAHLVGKAAASATCLNWPVATTVWAEPPLQRQHVSCFIVYTIV